VAWLNIDINFLRFASPRQYAYMAVRLQSAWFGNSSIKCSGG
jgi:hypothetical protein